jgi:hypothetical protein
LVLVLEAVQPALDLVIVEVLVVVELDLVFVVIVEILEVLVVVELVYFLFFSLNNTLL